MLDGATVQMENGTLAQLRRLAVQGGSWQTVLVAVELPESPQPRPSLPPPPRPAH